MEKSLYSGRSASLRKAARRERTSALTGMYRPTEDSMMNSNKGKFNAPSREAIYYRIHKLAYGASWKYDYETFVSWDAKNR